MSDRFVFTMDYVSRPKDPYYVTRWDRAKRIEIVAPTKQEAINKAAAALGDAGPHDKWVFMVQGIRDIQIVEAEGSAV